MKKISTRLQLTKTTVRVLQDSALAAVRGGDGVGEIQAPTTHPSNNPTHCSASNHCGKP